MSVFTVKEQKAIDYAVKLIKSKAMSGNVSFTSATSVQEYLHLKLATETREQFNVLFLNSQHQLIADEIMFSGTINQAPVFPREIIKKALFHNATAIILAHNHPSGLAEPSSADRTITDLIQDAANLMDIRVLDHIIVGSTKCYSFAEHALL